MNKKKFIVNNIKYLNKDHQVYLYDSIKSNSHTSNTNGFFFKLSEMDEEGVDNIYNFIDKIISAKNNLDDLKRMELRDDLEKGLKDEDIYDVITNTKDININNSLSEVISERKIYNMDEIESKMKDVFKPVKYNVDSIFFKLDKQMKMAKKYIKVQKQNKSILLIPNEEDSEEESEKTNDIQDAKVPREDANYTEEIEDDNEDDDEDIEDNEDDEDNEDNEEDNEDNEEDIEDYDVTEDEEEIDEERFRMLLLSKGYNVTDHSQLKEEPYKTFE
jgi:hypothetical protein